MLNVFSEQFAGNPYVAVVTQVQQLMMLLTGALDAVSQIQPIRQHDRQEPVRSRTVPESIALSKSPPL
jgi:hypothetical protein